jgi:hypothetical protein
MPVYANLATIGLYLESREISLTKTSEEFRVSLVMEVPITQLELLKSFVAMTTIPVEWQQLPIFAAASPFKTQFYEALSPGQQILGSIKAKYLKFYSYLKESPIVKTLSNCTLSMPAFNGKSIEEGSKQITLLKGGLIMTGTYCCRYLCK